MPNTDNETIKNTVEGGEISVDTNGTDPHVLENPNNADSEVSHTLRENLNMDWVMFNDDDEDYEANESDYETDPSLLQSDLAKWAIDHNISLYAASMLLKTLKSNRIDVPTDARTLFKTPRCGEFTVTEKSGGRYIYFGLKKCIEEQLKGLEPEDIEIDINIDGLPIFKSKNISVWPIQIAIVNIQKLTNRPFVVALFSGLHKPSNLDFLLDTITELKVLITDGVNGAKFVLRHIICDAPARSMVKGTVQFNGRYGCDFCEIRGTFEGRMLFLEKGRLRTNESFRSRSNPQHHKFDTPFLSLEIDMIWQFPLDPMHCVDLGVTKRLLVKVWKEGSRSSRLSQGQLARISNFNVAISSFFPTQFNRKPRALDEVKLWKATEFRTFLLYVGPVVLKTILDKSEYELFLSLSIGVAILYNRSLMDQHSAYANDLLNYFVSNANSRYGENFCSYNVHCLLHLVDVANKAGTLLNCTAYKFENNMGTMKRSVRGTGCPLVQLTNRMREKFLRENDVDADQNIHGRGLTLRSTGRKCYLLTSGQFAKLHEISEKEVLCEIFLETKPFFTKPCDSRIIGFHKGLQHKTEMKTMSRKDILEEAIMCPMHLLEETSNEVCLIKLNHNLI